MPAPRLVTLVVLLSTVALTAACTAAQPGPGAPNRDLERFYDQRLSWGPCVAFAVTDDDRAAFADRTFDCAYLEVPLDYAQPDGQTARIGVLRQRALDPPGRIGALVTNPGGPGMSGMSSLATTISPGVGNGELAQRFDLIGFDPRGVGASKPAIDCQTDAEIDADRADLDVDTSAAGVVQTEAENRQFVAQCVQRTGMPVLAKVGTRDVARDLDVLRAALGDPKLTFLGYSYGTRIGYTYAEEFPANVRALVLDGVVDPDEDPADRTVDQAAGFQQAFEAFAAWCAERQCPLGPDPARATAAYQGLVRPLIAKPVPAGQRVLGYPDAITGTTLALYVDEFWERLRRGLADLAAGDGAVLLRLADIYQERSRDGEYTNTSEAFTAVSCVDDARITDPAAALRLDRRYLAAAPFRDAGTGPSAARDKCAFWPVPVTGSATTPMVPGLPPTLVVSTTGDPATPYQAGVDLAQAMGGRLVTYEGNRHLASFQGVPCVDAAVTRYLVDLTLPTPGTRCTG